MDIAGHLAVDRELLRAPDAVLEVQPHRQVLAMKYSMPAPMLPTTDVPLAVIFTPCTRGPASLNSVKPTPTPTA